MPKSLFRRCLNRCFGFLARLCPGATTLRPLLHRARGVQIGHEVFIGEDVYIDSEYPEKVRIHDRVQISLRAMIIAHTRGPGQVIIEKEAFVGPNVVIVCSAGRVIRIGQGAVISAGCVVTRNVPAQALLTPAPTQLAGQATVPLTTAKSMEEFWLGLRLASPKPAPPPLAPADAARQNASAVSPEARNGSHSR